MLAYTVVKWPNQETTGRTRGFQMEQSLSTMQDFRTSSQSVVLSQFSKILQQLTGQISNHYSSSKIRNTHLCLFVQTKVHILYSDDE